MALLAIDQSVWLLAAILVAAVLYSSVGHGGASGYLAAMALFGLSPQDMKPAALIMNVFVASIVLVRLYRAGYFNIRLFAPFAIASVPMAYLGGAYLIDAPAYKYLVGAALLIAAGRLMADVEDRPAVGTPKAWISLPVGAATGFLAGLTGVGGGIFLSPIMLFLRWCDMRASAAIAAAFILVNSIAGLLGHATVAASWPNGLLLFVVVAVIGGLVGSELGARSLAPVKLRRLLAVVLVIAGAKMALTAWY